MFGYTFAKRSAQYAIRKLFFDTLYEKVVVGADMITVYDNAPKDVPVPFIKIADCKWEPDATVPKGFYRDNYFIQIEVHTHYGGSMLCAQILDEIVQVVSQSCIAGTFCLDSFKISLFELTAGEQTTAIDEDEEQGYVQYGFNIVQSS